MGRWTAAPRSSDKERETYVEEVVVADCPGMGTVVGVVVVVEVRGRT